MNELEILARRHQQTQNEHRRLWMRLSAQEQKDTLQNEIRRLETANESLRLTLYGRPPYDIQRDADNIQIAGRAPGEGEPVDNAFWNELLNRPDGPALLLKAYRHVAQTLGAPGEGTPHENVDSGEGRGSGASDSGVGGAAQHDDTHDHHDDRPDDTRAANALRSDVDPLRSGVRATRESVQVGRPSSAPGLDTLQAIQALKVYVGFLRPFDVEVGADEVYDIARDNQSEILARLKEIESTLKAL